MVNAVSIYLLHMVTLLHLMVNSFSNVLSLRRHHSGLNILPATLKILSTGAEEAGMVRFSQVSTARFGKVFRFSYQNNKGSVPSAKHGVRLCCIRCKVVSLLSSELYWFAPSVRRACRMCMNLYVQTSRQLIAAWLCWLQWTCKSCCQDHMLSVVVMRY